MKIKICGLKRLEDITYINDVNVDFAGFIFVSTSKRRVSVDSAISMKKLLNPEIKSVGVFANEELAVVKEIYDEKVIDLIQLHGNEDNVYINELKKLTGGKIIKAYPGNENLENLINNTSADYILIDSKDETGFGGTGKTFDYSLIPKTDKKIFLAGGINVLNVENAILRVKPYCIDINSGVETNGRKDKMKIAEIVKKIRKIELKGKDND